MADSSFFVNSDACSNFKRSRLSLESYVHDGNNGKMRFPTKRGTNCGTQLTTLDYCQRMIQRLPLFHRYSSVLLRVSISLTASPRKFSRFVFEIFHGRRRRTTTYQAVQNRPWAISHRDINDDVMQSDDTSMAREPEASSSSAVAVELAPTKEPEKGKRRDASGWAKSRRGRDSDKKNIGRKRRGTRNDEARAEVLKVLVKVVLLLRRVLDTPNGNARSYSASVVRVVVDADPNARTIEGVLFDALVKAGAVSEDNADDPVKVNLARAARTDAGVHAAGNVVSLKMITSRPDVPDILARVNEELPPEIRLWDM
ncbi:tRNA uridine synthase [Salix suchowensis]|nr:tRNA uridine synthase [Salix suchowensis]